MPDLWGLRVYDQDGDIRLDTNDRQARLVMSYYSTYLAMPGVHDIIVPGISANDPTWSLSVGKCFYYGVGGGNGAIYIPEDGKVRIASSWSFAQTQGLTPQFVASFEVYRI